MTPGEMASTFQGNGDGLDPMDCILQDKKVAESKHQLMWQEGVRRAGSEIEKKGALRTEHTAEFHSPRTTPIQVLTPAAAIVVTSVLLIDVVRRRSDDHVDGSILERSQSIDTVLVTQI